MEENDAEMIYVTDSFHAIFRFRLDCAHIAQNFFRTHEICVQTQTVPYVIEGATTRTKENTNKHENKG